MRGGETYGAHEVNPRLYGQPGAVSRGPLTNVSPIQQWPKTMASQAVALSPIARGGITATVNLRTLARDIESVVMGSPNAYFYDINRTNPAFMDSGRPNYTRLGHTMRTMIGDTAQRGGSQFMRGATSLTPFLNVFTQSLGATMRSFRDNPIHWLGGTLIPLVTASLASHYSALVSGKEHQDYLANHVSSAQEGSNVLMFHGPGTSPDQHTEIPLPQIDNAI